jgi:membrane protein
MARLHDLHTIATTIGLREFARRVWQETLDDDLFLFAAALAYAWLFAVFPFFIFLLTLVQVMPGSSGPQVIDDANVFLRALLPDHAADAMLNVLKDPISSQSRIPAVTLMISSVVTLWAASGGIAVTMAALDRCYELTRVRSYYKRRPMAIALTVIVSLLSLAIILLVPVGAVFQTWVIEQHMERVSFWAIWISGLIRGALALCAGLLILAVIYHWGPGVKRCWRAVTPGSAFCMIAWVVLAMAFKFYVNQFSESHYQRTYGAAGWVWILLVMFYLDALVLLIGAEINSEIEFELLKVTRGSANFRLRERAASALAASAKLGQPVSEKPSL